MSAGLIGFMEIKHNFLAAYPVRFLEGEDARYFLHASLNQRVSMSRNKNEA